MAVRDGVPGTSGWLTHAITPGPLRPLSLFDEGQGGLFPRYMGAFSGDLSHGLFLSNTPLASGSPFTDVVPNLYALRFAASRNGVVSAGERVSWVHGSFAGESG
jgi:hypothetical protein